MERVRESKEIFLEAPATPPPVAWLRWWPWEGVRDSGDMMTKVWSRRGSQVGGSRDSLRAQETPGQGCARQEGPGHKGGTQPSAASLTSLASAQSQRTVSLVSSSSCAPGTRESWGILVTESGDPTRLARGGAGPLERSCQLSAMGTSLCTCLLSPARGATEVEATAAGGGRCLACQPRSPAGPPPGTAGDLHPTGHRGPTRFSGCSSPSRACSTPAAS